MKLIYIYIYTLLIKINLTVGGVTCCSVPVFVTWVIAKDLMLMFSHMQWSGPCFIRPPPPPSQSQSAFIRQVHINISFLNKICLNQILLKNKPLGLLLVDF